jgi:type VI secretion system secreted protein VgrG
MPNRVEIVQGQDELTVSAGQRVRIGAASDTTVGTHLSLRVSGNHTLNVDGQLQQQVRQGHRLSAKLVTLVAQDELVLRCGDASIVLRKNGDIEIVGKDISLKASGKINAKGSGDVAVKGYKVGGN